MPPRRLAILESDWFAGYNHTVRPFFEGLSRTLFETADGFHYERFVGRSSFDEAFRHLVRKPDVRFLYVASHGERSHIQCPNGKRVTRAACAETLTSALEDTRLDGLYFASCLFGTRRTGELLRQSATPRDRRPKWIAGYGSAIDWMESMALDWLFWNKLLDEAGFAPEATSPVARVRAVVDYLADKTPDLCRSLEFRVFVRTAGAGDVVDLVADRLSPTLRFRPVRRVPPLPAPEIRARKRPNAA